MTARHARERAAIQREAEQLYPTECPACAGYGMQGRRISVYEHGCGFAHDDVEEWDCPECDGTGQVLAPYEAPDDWHEAAP